MSWSNATVASNRQYELINTTGGIKHGRADLVLSPEDQVIARERGLKTIPTNWPVEIVTTKQNDESKQTIKTHMEWSSSDLSRSNSGLLNWALGQRV
jgi:hypothetical protein